MIITIHGKNIEVTETLQNAVEKSLNRLNRFNKYINDETRAKVEIRSYPEKIYKITVNINIPLNRHIQCQIKHQDLYVAIKQLINPLTQQLNYFKTQKENWDSVGTGEAVLENYQESNFDSSIDVLDETDSFNDYDNKF